MGRPRLAKPCKLLVGLLSGDSDLLARAGQLLRRAWGAVDLVSDTWPFDQTEYYRNEMGPGLQRRFLGFEQLVRPDLLPELKLEANVIEQMIGDDCLLPDIPRPVNIDPGYLELSKLVLASTKDAAHRVYLSQGIYAEIELQYAHGTWQIQPWTYADYRQPVYHEFFTRLRERFRIQQQETSAAPSEGNGDPA